MYLQIEQLVKHYGTKRVVAGIDLTMEEGEILSLLGPSGCGKTTILRMLAGLVKPDSGVIRVGPRIFFDGRRDLAVEDRQIGMVFQDYALWPHMTVAKNIAFGLRLRGVSRAETQRKVAELLELVNLPGLGQRYPYQLSGGQQQRVAVARALATEPRLILLDEPLSSLDTGLRENMLAEMTQLFRRLKSTVVNVTHDQNEAMSMSDRIMVLRDGVVQQLGTPAELYQHPANRFVAAFMGGTNLLVGRLGSSRQPGFVSLDLESGLFGTQQMLGMLSQPDLSQEQTPCTLVCRPADICLHGEIPADERPNVLSGTVTFSSFVGGRWKTLIEVGQGQKQVLTAFATRPFSLQSIVWAELPPEDCLVVAQ